MARLPDDDTHWFFILLIAAVLLAALGLWAFDVWLNYQTTGWGMF